MEWRRSCVCGGGSRWRARWEWRCYVERAVDRVRDACRRVCECKALGLRLCSCMGVCSPLLHALVLFMHVLCAHVDRAKPVSISQCKIFMIHSGGDAQRIPLFSVCGKAWCTLPIRGQDVRPAHPLPHCRLPPPSSSMWDCVVFCC